MSMPQGCESCRNHQAQRPSITSNLYEVMSIHRIQFGEALCPMCKLALESLPFRMFQSKMLPILRVDFETTLNFENYTYNARLVDQVVTPYVSSGEEKNLEAANTDRTADFRRVPTPWRCKQELVLPFRASGQCCEQTSGLKVEGWKPIQWVFLCKESANLVPSSILAFTISWEQSFYGRCFKQTPEHHDLVPCRVREHEGMKSTPASTTDAVRIVESHVLHCFYAFQVLRLFKPLFLISSKISVPIDFIQFMDALIGW